ncbi:class I SAM-dependent methyltransferase [Sulfurivermis fontis]|uniref:class I SAM-dependent methyltransferase n=1 Tax=Sulfurivermis fontis TaxID=1972068 RepID=UPI001559F43A|nr:methyltransferase domain-containing protein [Sulfurivermis fontis]
MQSLSRHCLWLCWLLAALACGPLPAEENVAPGINRHYENPDFAQWRATFEQPGREVYARRMDILAATAVRPGMTVADIGAGSGLFTLLFAREVGTQGRVYAVDIAPEFVAGIAARAREEGYGNVVGVVSEQRSTRLASDAIDLAFVCDTYHHFEYPQAMLASIHQALRPGGRLIIIDFRREAGFSSPWVMGHVRAGEAQVIAEVTAAGFTLTAQPDLLRSNYFLIFTKQ